MERIMIIGCSGSGKSTLARKLGEKRNIPVVHLDRLWWRPGWEHISREEFDGILAAELEKPRWIVDGNYNRTLQARADKCDTIIYLDFNRFLCLFGAIQRYLMYSGKARPDMNEGCPERLDWDFVKFIWNFNKENRERNYCLLNEAEGAETIVLKNRRQVRRFLESL